MVHHSHTLPKMSASDRRGNLMNHHGSSLPYGSSAFTEARFPMSDYAPRMVTPRWLHIHDFTHAAVADMATPRKRSEYGAYLAVASRLVHWATGYGSIALDYTEIFHPDTISDYMQSLDSDVGHDIYNRTRRLLTQMSETLVHAETNRVPPPGYGLGNTAPFASAAFVGLANWADQLSDPGHRRDADATLALCGGAGLSGSELFHARAQDLVFREDGVFIFVPGKYPRSVPVHWRWEGRLRSRFADTHPLARLVAPGVSRSRRLPTWVTPGSRPAAADAAELSARLRATWVERTENLLDTVAAAHFSGYSVAGGPGAARELAKTIDFEASAAILRGAGEDW